MTRFRVSGKEIINSIALSMLYVFGILLSTGTLFSGYHLIDDHEIIKYKFWYDSGSHSCYELLTGGFVWKNERFRPLYEVIRRIRCIIYGDNWTIWSITVAFEIVLIVVYSYFFARLWRSNYLTSGLFALIVVTGEQSAVWWRLGPQEATGTLLMMAALLCLQIYVISKKKRWCIVGVLLAILCSMTKESFTIMLPFIVLLILVYAVWYNDEGHSLMDYIRAIKQYAPIIIVCAVVFFAELIYILVHTGINSVEYAGIDYTMSILGYIKRMGGMLLFRFSIYFWLMFVVAVIAAIYMSKKGKLKHFIINRWDICIVLVLMILTQVFLYAKSGMFERYFMPSTMAIAMLLTIVLNDVFEEKRSEYLNLAFLTICLLYLLANKVIPNANSYSRIGNDISSCMEYVNNECNKEDIILAMGKADEENLGIESYLEYSLGYENVVSYDLDSFHDKVVIVSDKINISDNSKVEYIIADKKFPQVDGFVIEADFGSFYLMKKMI